MPRRFPATGAPRKKEPKRERVRRWLDQQAGAAVDGEAFRALRAELAPISAAYLRRLLEQAGAVMTAEVEGVRLDGFENLERSLTHLATLYEAGQPGVRAVVLEAKQRARWASRQAKDARRRAEKEEMARWLLVWLENPGIFPVWVALKRKAQEQDAARGADH